MPGLIDGHVRFMINDDYGRIETDREVTDMAYNSVIVARRALLDGFTAVREANRISDPQQRAEGHRRCADAGLLPR